MLKPEKSPFLGLQLVSSDSHFTPLDLDRLSIFANCLNREVDLTYALDQKGKDGLTGLLSRDPFKFLLMESMKSTYRKHMDKNVPSNDYLGILFLDLNGFKAVNDMYGP